MPTRAATGIAQDGPSAIYAPGATTGYTSVSDFLDANQGTLANEAKQIGSGVGDRIDQAHSAADQAIAADTGAGYTQDYTTLPGYKDALDKAIAAKDQATALGDQGGLSDYFQKNLHDSTSQGDFDAQLLGASGKLDAAGLQGRASGLIDYLNQGLAGVQPPAPPPPPEPRDPEQPATIFPADPRDGTRRGPAQPYPYTPPAQGSHTPVRRPRGPGAPV